jgi:beta-RFAP synthase
MSRSVRVTTGSRLHFGPLASAGPDGGRFGGLGMMIDAPVCRVVVSPSERDEIDGSESAMRRARAILAAFRQALGANVPHCRITVEQGIPSHQGLGSGTQLGMAVAKALAVFGGAEAMDLFKLARLASRGRRSAIGIHGFAHGGLILDGGRAENAAIGELTARVDFPEAWRVLLVTPPRSSGLAGAAEVDAFAKLPAMPANLTDDLTRLATREILPSARAAKFREFSESLFEFGRRVGAYFEPVQGGDFADARMAALVDWLRERGVPGAAQTSWGPTLSVMQPDAPSATQLQSEIQANAAWSNCRIEIVRGLNRGAEVYGVRK